MADPTPLTDTELVDLREQYRGPYDEDFRRVLDEAARLRAENVELEQRRASLFRRLGEHMDDLGDMTAERDALTARVEAAAALHKLERRYTPDDGLTSFDTAEEAAGAEDIPIGAVTYFEVCSHCGSIELGDHGGDYRESLAPCKTRVALGLDTEEGETNAV